MKENTETNSFEMSRQLRFLGPPVAELSPASDWSAGSAEDELEVLEPSEGGGEHVHPRPVPPRPRLHRHADVQMFTSKCSVAVVLLVDGIFWKFIRSTRHHTVVIQGVG